MSPSAKSQSDASTLSQQRQWLVGCGIFLCALSCFSLLDALAKDLVHRYSAPLVNFARYSVIVVLAFAVMRVKRVSIHAPKEARTLLVLRGALLGIVGICFIPALQYLPLAEGTAIYFIAPLIVVIFAPFVLGERVSWKQYAAVLVGMLGMLLIVNPGGDLSLIGSALMLTSACAYALVQLLTRKLANRVESEQMFVYAASTCWFMGFAVMLVFWPEVWPRGRDMLEMLLMGACGGVGQYLLILAFKRVPASTLAPLNYFQLALAVILGELFFGQMPNLQSFAGISLIVSAGLALTLPILIASLRLRSARRSQL
jgi:drug/metabolite transporter (DMT)-like permease